MRMLVLILYVSAAVIMDLITYQIKNGWIIIGFILGLCVQYSEFGMIGILYAAAGMAVPILCLWLLFCIRAMGAGDLKLLAAVGAMIGPVKMIDCILYTMLAGGMIALGLMICRRNLKERLIYLFCYLKKLIRTGRYEPYYEEGDRKDSFTMHFSVAVLVSVFLYWEGFY